MRRQGKKKLKKQPVFEQVAARLGEIDQQSESDAKEPVGCATTLP